MGFLIKVVVGWILLILIIYVSMRIADIWGKVGIIIKVCVSSAGVIDSGAVLRDNVSSLFMVRLKYKRRIKCSF